MRKLFQLVDQDGEPMGLIEIDTEVFGEDFDLSEHIKKYSDVIRDTGCDLFDFLELGGATRVFVEESICIDNSII